VLSQYHVDTIDLQPISLDNLAIHLRKSLSTSFQSVQIGLVQSNFTAFGWMKDGFGKSCHLLDFGSFENILRAEYRKKHFDIESVLDQTSFGENVKFILGSSAANYFVNDENGELVPNCDDITCESLEAFVGPDAEVHVIPYSNRSTGFIGNLIASDGTPGLVVKIRVENRTTSVNDFGAILNTALSSFPNMGFAAVTNLVKGLFTFHVMPSVFPSNNMTDSEVAQWLKYFNQTSDQGTFTCATRIIPNASIRRDSAAVHSHCFRQDHEFAGHYQNDNSPEVIYEAYLMACDTLTYANTTQLNYTQH